MPSARIRRLSLTNFRSYHAAQVEVGAGPVLLRRYPHTLIYELVPRGT